MRLILHIGMGKTGSSAIQAALRRSGEKLRAQGAEYLGMWFDMVDPQFHGLKNQERFFSLGPEEMERAADALHGVLRERETGNGTSIFVLSNEALSGRAAALKPLIDRLRGAGVDVRAIGYVRHPAAWLPSAHVQWSIRDKVEPGPILPYGVRARKLVTWYGGLIAWGRLLGDILDLRSYDRAEDIVADFAEASGLELEGRGERVLERGEDAEILMRALFNNRFPGHTLPQVFDRAIFRTSSEIPELEEMAGRCFDYSETADILAEHDAMFAEFAELFGFDPRDTPREPPPPPDMEHVRARILDYLTEILFRQALKIERLEARLAELEKARPQAEARPEPV